ncbi:protein-disulfide reductase DsbD family protein [Cognatiyoonia sp. IB215446]|uniref:protein-disulfide reductase DsbD domain-containing protein n=1 Tax=Cognatiyoonia sp. IB215446 TaxID=3097355 RepID=UPI002A168E77|nr:protein-disulfide reductase DsbD domain-containing protein [Cognatiyoonia sp. IB215446]MDX8350062.1 protein-disulfide reductase DsbD family protein [Cognatiyoonia sp. IB215446]
MRKTTLISLALAALPVFGAAGPFDDLASVEILPGWRNAGGEHMAGLRITMDEGWKTYWRAPGDGGIPPQFSLTGSENITGFTPHWPVPELFYQNDMYSVGYENSVIFPLRLYSVDPEAPMRISGQIHIGVCEEICIPVTLDFDELLPVGGERDAAITAALINRPLTADEANVGAVICQIDPISDGLQVTTVIDVPPMAAKEFVVVEAGDDHVWVSEADIARDGNRLSATVDMVHHSGEAFALDRSAVRITVLGDNQAIDIQGCAAG